METEMGDCVTDEVVALIRQFVSQRFPLANSLELTNELSLFDTGIVDSMGVLDLVGFIEEQFKVEVQDDDLMPENFETIDALARYVEERR